VIERTFGGFGQQAARMRRRDRARTRRLQRIVRTPEIGGAAPELPEEVQPQRHRKQRAQTAEFSDAYTPPRPACQHALPEQRRGNTAGQFLQALCPHARRDAAPGERLPEQAAEGMPRSARIEVAGTAPRGRIAEVPATEIGLCRLPAQQALPFDKIADEPAEKFEALCVKMGQANAGRGSNAVAAAVESRRQQPVGKSIVRHREAAGREKVLPRHDQRAQHHLAEVVRFHALGKSLGEQRGVEIRERIARERRAVAAVRAGFSGLQRFDRAGNGIRLRDAVRLGEKQAGRACQLRAKVVEHHFVAVVLDHAIALAQQRLHACRPRGERRRKQYEQFVVGGIAALAQRPAGHGLRRESAVVLQWQQHAELRRNCGHDTASAIRPCGPATDSVRGSASRYANADSGRDSARDSPCRLPPRREGDNQ
jgi:hypothetical protein